MHVRHVIRIETNSLKNLAKMQRMIPPVFSCICASANAGPACIRAIIISSGLFSCMYCFCAGGISQKHKRKTSGNAVAHTTCSRGCLALNTVCSESWSSSPGGGPTDGCGRIICVQASKSAEFVALPGGEAPCNPRVCSHDGTSAKTTLLETTLFPVLLFLGLFENTKENLKNIKDSEEIKTLGGHFGPKKKLPTLRAPLCTQPPLLGNSPHPLYFQTKSTPPFSPRTPPPPPAPETEEKIKCPKWSPPSCEHHFRKA